MKESAWRGRMVGESCKLKYIKKTMLWTLTATLKNGSWQDEWAAYGLTNATVPKPGHLVTLPVVVLVDTEAFAADVTRTYTATAGKSGTAR